MTDKVALVTGGNKSIGLASVRELARQGYIVYLGSRDEAAGKAAAEEAKGDGDIRPIRLDVKDWDSLEAAVALIEKTHGHLDALVNNAGVAQNPKGASTADWDKVRDTMEVNVYGAARLIQLALPLLQKSEAGRVVNVSSGAGSIQWIIEKSFPMGSMKPFAYGLSKAAMNAMTALFAEELKDTNIKVNACSPGFVKSALNHFMGTETPESGAKIVVHLATLPTDGPTGGFVDQNNQTVPW